jgi:hypothetical protein
MGSNRARAVLTNKNTKGVGKTNGTQQCGSIKPRDALQPPRFWLVRVEQEALMGTRSLTLPAGLADFALAGADIAAASANQQRIPITI